MMVALSALVVDLDRELLRLGYKDSTMIWYRQCWRRLETFFADLGVEEFSLEIAMAWVDAACDFFAKEQSGTLPADGRLFVSGRSDAGRLCGSRRCVASL
ncbi:MULTISPECIES: hypothetical protein [Rhizobium/Agrobacterium group]|uniref:hypothetical protein n=1 Tax=Rhizobium/Agrobacterium group TaxID=227290 RepID=UPI0018D26AC1|nr:MULTISPECIES: hypothetical protein [Rhizobium/Agrobacterium group]